MDLARLEGDVDAVVCRERAEALDDSTRSQLCPVR
jgi:hypothetical protein